VEKKRKTGCSIWGIIGIIFLLYILFTPVWLSKNKSIDDDFFPERINGFFICSAPKVMSVNVPDDFTVWITRDSIRDVDFFMKNLSENDQTLIKKVRVGHIMEVNLVELDTLNQNFSINALNSEEQILDKYDPAVWKWKITALKEGFHYLIVVAKIKMMTQDLEVIGYKDLPVIERRIKVKTSDYVLTEEVNFKANSNNYYWLITIPFLGFIFWFFTRKKRKSEKRKIGIEEYEKFKSTIQLLISKDKIDESFDLVERISRKYEDNKLIKELIQLKSNYTNNKSRNNRNLISNDEFNLNRSKVINELLELIEKFNVKKDEAQ